MAPSANSLICLGTMLVMPWPQSSVFSVSLIVVSGYVAWIDLPSGMK